MKTRRISHSTTTQHSNSEICQVLNPWVTHSSATSTTFQHSLQNKQQDQTKTLPQHQAESLLKHTVSHSVVLLIPYTNVTSVVSMKQWSQSAYRYGDYVVKYAVFPIGDKQKELESVMIKDTDPMDILSQNLRRFHAEEKATFGFFVQFLENIDDQPVEDTGLEWDETKYPFQQVATLEFEKQDSFDNAFRTWFDDSGVACNPWHGLVTLQPLGGANRVRRAVYAESRKKRLAMNGRKEYTEPKSVQEVPVSA